MKLVHTLIVSLHIGVGALALVLFWVPMLAKKGGRTHVRAGRLYTGAMAIVGVTALMAAGLALIDPLAIKRPDAVLDPEQAARIAHRVRVFNLFLLMLGTLTLTSLRHGLLVLRTPWAPNTLAWHRASVLVLGGLGVVVGGLGIFGGVLLLVIFGVVSVAGAVGMYRDLLKPSFEGPERIGLHLSSMVGTGIAAYTAFFAFGGARLLSEVLTGQWRVVPWVLPTIVGTIAIRRMRRALAAPLPGRG